MSCHMFSLFRFYLTLCFLSIFKQQKIDLCFGVAVKEKIESNEPDDDDDDEKDEPTKNIKSNLQSRGRICVSKENGDDILLKSADDNSFQFSRFFNEIYNEFRNLLSKNSKSFDNTTYPKNRRFGVFVDRDNGSTKDEITFFEVCCIAQIGLINTV